MHEVSPVFINRKRKERLQQLRSELPPRCNFAEIIKQRIENKGVSLNRAQIYAMIRGNYTVHVEVLNAMEELVGEVREMA